MRTGFALQRVSTSARLDVKADFHLRPPHVQNLFRFFPAPELLAVILS